MATGAAVATTHAPAVSATSRLAGSASLQCERFRVHGPRCRRVFVTRLDWLATNPRCTQRCAMHVGALGRERANTAVAKAEPLHDRTFKDLDTICRCSRLHASQPIGVDEIAIRKGHDLFIVVSDLDRWRPIGVGGTNRTEADRDSFFAARGANKATRIPFATRDRWKPFHTSLPHQAPPARVICDPFHLVRHFGDALDAVHRREYRRQGRAGIKGQRDTWRSHREHLSLDGRRSLAPVQGHHVAQHRLPAHRVFGPARGLPA